MDLFESFINNIKGVIGSGDVSKISDKSFSEAIELIHDVQKQTEATVDLHGNNYMIRRGKFGIQLVITDPLEG